MAPSSQCSSGKWGIRPVIGPWRNPAERECRGVAFCGSGVCFAPSQATPAGAPKCCPSAWHFVLLHHKMEKSIMPSPPSHPPAGLQGWASLWGSGAGPFQAYLGSCLPACIEAELLMLECPYSPFGGMSQINEGIGFKKSRPKWWSYRSNNSHHKRKLRRRCKLLLTEV